jgi:hypothetical protein
MHVMMMAVMSRKTVVGIVVKVMMGALVEVVIMEIMAGMLMAFH